MRELTGRLALAVVFVVALLASGCSTPSQTEEDVSVPEVKSGDATLCQGTYGCCPGGGLGNCGGEKYCEDHNCDQQCVAPSCAYGETCEFDLLPVGQLCNLGDPCIWNTACTADGLCEGVPADCDDGNVCTMDSCDPETGECVNEVKVAAECDDENLCTVGDECNEDGICKPGVTKDCSESGMAANDCIDLECDQKTGECTVEVVRDEGDKCIDGDPCTWLDKCDAEGGCAGSPHECEKIFATPCKTGTCNESKPDDGSDGAGSCLPKWLPEGSACPDEDGSKCTVADKCLPIPDGNGAMECLGTLIDCDDDNPCTDAYCDQDTGECTTDFLSIPCDDGNECTAGDFCEEGECESIEEKDCSDDVDCTVDMCDAGECKHVPNNLACDDGLYCNGLETCSLDSGCQNGDAPVLDDGVLCTVDGCDEENDSVTHTADSSLCDDADVCNGAETCDAAQGCLTGETLVCDDEIDCTEDSCDADDGCLFVAADAACDDSDICSADSCDLADGCVHLPAPDAGDECCGEDDDCDDVNICTDDTCGGDFHCQFVNKDDGSDCTDGLKCTLDDACLDGQCIGSADDCNDGLDCTVDSCDGDAGCINTPDSDFCDDENICTGTEECDPNAEGPATGCKAINPLVCDDGTDCTYDACDAVDGCSSVPQDGTCDDNNQCTLDVCDDEQDCLHTYVDGSDDDMQCCEEEDAECSDGIPCTKDTCDLDTHKCEASAMANGQACSPNDLCKLSGVCQNGTCAAPSKVCEDNVACTTNDCEPDSGCTYVGSDQYCDDENDCTSESCNIDDDCVYVELEGQECDDGNAGTVDDICVQDLCTGLPDPDADGIANEGYDSGCTNAQTEGCNDNCPDVPNGDQADDNGNGVGDVCDGDSTILDLYEPCADISPAFKNSQCDAGGPAYGNHTSSWQRTDEPYELPLVNGILDDSVVAYYPLDGTGKDLSSSMNHGFVQSKVTAIDGAFGPLPQGMNFASDCGGSGCKSGRIVAPNNPKMNMRTNSFSVMLWVKHEPVGDSSCGDAEHAFGYRDVAGGANGIVVWMQDSQMSGKGQLAMWQGPCYTPSGVRVDDGEWHHAAFVRHGANEVQVYIDGSLTASDTCGQDINIEAKVVVGGLYESENCPWLGDLDDVLVFSRALSPYEIESYYRSTEPYGYSLVPGAQPDLDDIRISEKAADGQAASIVHEVIGPRPHSDTPCPMNQDDGTWADRDDLCGVVGYWKLDGNGADSTGGFEADIGETAVVAGRFGDALGALHIVQQGDGAEVADSPGLNPQQFTLETWVRLDEDPGNDKVILAKTDGASGYVFYVHGSDKALRFLCYDSNSPTGTSIDFRTLGQATQMVGSGWHHLAVTSDGQSAAYYYDGLPLTGAGDTTGACPVSSAPFTIGRGHNLSVLPGAIDEVVLHGAVKSPDYIYRRANPGLPSVRFLADTEQEPDGETYKYKSYTLKWGNEDAEHEVPLVDDKNNVNGGKPCVGLLSPCNGYAGWWRFNEGSGNVVADQSTVRSPASFSGIGSWVGMPGGGTALAGADSPLTAQHHPQHHVDAFTIESLVRMAIVTQVDYPLSKSDNYQLLFYEGQPRAQFQHGAGNTASVSGDGKVPANQWFHAASRFDGSLLGLLLDYGLEKEGTNEFTVMNAVQDIRLALNSTGPATFFAGAVATVRLMNRALESDELLHHPLTQAWELPYQCVPSCGSKECGDDGCGGSCGDCKAGGECNAQGYCIIDGMVRIPGGSFWRGCNASKQNCACLARELPYEPITLSPFWADATEVTNSAYSECVSAGACVAAGCNAGDPAKLDHPVACVPWGQADTYCTWADKRLCTEAEWEKAARGTQGNTYPWGNAEPTCDLAQMGGCPGGNTLPVGSLPLGASPYGILDMSGNVWEWVADYYSATYYAGSPKTDPQGPDSSDSRVKRGGGWNSSGCGGGDNNVRSANRNYFGEPASEGFLGFRCCADGD
jgi:formylglycine-generating enzyme required for sulfatase activity